MEPSFNPPPSPLTEYPSSGLSEVDSLSDSDWLDISSNRESDDNDSLCSRDSDHDGVDHLPRSRRSSTSNISSRDSEVEAWEGFVEDSADEGAPIEHALTPISTVAQPAADDSPGTAIQRTHPLDGDIAEDQRVKQALDQSMISTLSSSRSSALGGPHSSVHSSSRDLRLSFPDPLTSSRDQLNTSYENVSPTESQVGDTDDSEDSDEPDAAPASGLAEDPGLTATPSDPSDRSFKDVAIHTPDVDIVLYGCFSAIHFSFVEKLLEKVAVGARLALAADASSGAKDWSHIQGKSEKPTAFPNVAIIDRLHYDSFSSNRPSLAIVYLPYPVLFRNHTFYLPVLPNHRFDSLRWKSLENNHDSWDFRRIPSQKIFPLKEGGNSSLVEIEDLDRLDPLHVYRAFEQLTQSKKKLPKQLKPVHLVTIFAVLSLVLGVVVNVSIRSFSSIATSTSSPPAINLWHRLRPFANHSAAIPPTPAETNMAIIPSSLKDFAVAVFNPVNFATTATPSSSPRLSRRSPVSTEETAGKSKQPENGRLMSWSERVQSTKDIILHPVTAAEHRSRGLSLIARKPSGDSDKPSSSLTAKIPNSLADLYELSNFVAEAFRRDLKDLVDALDELMQAINRQTTIVVQQSKGAAHHIGDHLQKRHAKAQVKARQLKEMGGQLVAAAGEQIRGRANIAKDKARALRENIVASDVWVEYRERIKEAVEVSHHGRTKRSKKQRTRKRRQSVRWKKISN